MRRRLPRSTQQHDATADPAAKLSVLPAAEASSGICAVILDRQPDPAYADGIVALTDAIVLHMFDSTLGEALRMAYTTIQERQSRQARQTHLRSATEGLRAYLDRLDAASEEP